MINQYQFIVPVFRRNSTDNGESFPRLFIFKMTREQAAYYLRRIALLKEVCLVDKTLTEMVYQENPGTWWYYLNDSEDGPPNGEDPITVTSGDVHIMEDRIYWQSYHSYSDSSLETELISRVQLEKLAKGETPAEDLFDDDGGEESGDGNEDDSES